MRSRPHADSDATSRQGVVRAMTPGQDLLTPEQAAGLLGCSARTVQRYIAAGVLAGTRRPCRTTLMAVRAFQEQHSLVIVPPATRTPDAIDVTVGHSLDTLSQTRPYRPTACMGVYAITHTPTGRTYIGSSLDIEARWRDHRATLMRGRHGNRRLQLAWSADGAGAFTWAVRDYAETEDELPAMEEQWIACVRPYYNQRQIPGRVAARPRARYVPRLHAFSRLEQATAPRMHRDVTGARPAPRGAEDVPTDGSTSVPLSFIERLVAAMRDLEREVGRLEAELAQARREAAGSPRQWGGRRENGQRVGVLGRVGLWLRTRG